VGEKRLLFIGLDAADAHLIDRWGEEGWLPNITRMKAQGTHWADMKTPADVFHVAAWPSIFTGTAADVHGLYHAYVTRPGHQGLLRPRPDQSPVPFVWKLLNDRQRQSVVMDAFLTCPLQNFNGIQIVDWGSWSWFWDPTVLPASVGRQIKNRFGDYPFEDHSRVGITPVADFVGFRERLLRAVAKKAEVVRWLLERNDWDLFLVVFGEAHPAGHYLWHLHDKDYFLRPSDSESLRNALRDVYVALDTAIGELCRSVARSTTVMLVSGDGMGPNYSGSHLLDDVLVRLGVLATAGATETVDRSRGGGGPPVRRDLMSTVRNMIPQRLRLAISDALLSRKTKERLSLRWKTAGISWPETKAYVIENANEGYVRINLKGREPLGVVAPGDEYEQVRDLIYRVASALVNPQNGRPAASAVVKPDDTCRGPRRADMPDVVILWDSDAHVTTELLLDTHGVVRSPAASCQVPPFYTGNHTPRAFTVAVGPGIPEGLVERERSVLDIAPTILAEFGIERPDHMPGRALWAGPSVSARAAGPTNR
jgi:predicted AlkP superfamily phosphohydrolase/phosphomutase